MDETFQNRKRIYPMTDQWTEKLRCPLCHNTGSVSLCQCSGDDIPTVRSLAGGFKAVSTEYGPAFHCNACNVSVV
jgi:hypothetical protein